MGVDPEIERRGHPGHEATRIYLVSSFLGNFLLAGVGAEAMRAWSLGRRTSENSEAVASVAVDCLIGLLLYLGSRGPQAGSGVAR